MNKAELKTVESMLGYQPNDAMQILLLEQVKAGKTMQEAISEYVMPDMAIIGADNKFSYKGQRITVKEYEEMAPLGPYAKLIVIKTRE